MLQPQSSTIQGTLQAPQSSLQRLVSLWLLVLLQVQHSREAPEAQKTEEVKVAWVAWQEAMTGGARKRSHTNF